tara:strand:+ start:73 stop:495 length:423 start_codon:yes stop_codon:yes gene_type:complete
LTNIAHLEDPAIRIVRAGISVTRVTLLAVVSSVFIALTKTLVAFIGLTVLTHLAVKLCGSTTVLFTLLRLGIAGLTSRAVRIVRATIHTGPSPFLTVLSQITDRGRCTLNLHTGLFDTGLTFGTLAIINASGASSWATTG